jgi:aryl-alcohol dehydrogenase-like predicted oxidoreductase
MGMSDLYGATDEKEALQTIRSALDVGINLLDTGDFYGMGVNEHLIARALKEFPRDKVLLSVKFGALRDLAGNWIGFDGRPEAVRNFIAYSLRRLKTDYTDIYRPARLDPRVPIEETIGAISDLVKAGYVRAIGLSEVGSETIRRAAKVHPITDLQIKYAITSRSLERSILLTCRELGIGITAYGVLGRGLLGGKWRQDQSARTGHIRSIIPRFQDENLQQNLDLVERIRLIALGHSASISQIAIAWSLSKGDDIFSLIGARRLEQVYDALGALEISLSSQDIAQLGLIADLVKDTRYAAPQMAHLASER